jgi:hypothetical protein
MRPIFMFLFIPSLVTLSLSLIPRAHVLEVHSIAWYVFFGILGWAGVFFFFHMSVRPFNTLGGRSARQRSREGGGELPTYLHKLGR